MLSSKKRRSECPTFSLPPLPVFRNRLRILANAQLPRKFSCASLQKHGRFGRKQIGVDFPSLRLLKRTALSCIPAPSAVLVVVLQLSCQRRVPEISVTLAVFFLGGSKGEEVQDELVGTKHGGEVKYICILYQLSSPGSSPRKSAAAFSSDTCKVSIFFPCNSSGFLKSNLHSPTAYPLAIPTVVQNEIVRVILFSTAGNH